MLARLEAVYCDGWDAGVVNPLTAATAKARDAVGEPYTVLFLLNGRLRAAMDLSWCDGYCRITRFDAADRTLSMHLLRGTGDGDLFLREARTWDGPADAGRYEYPHVATRTTTTYSVSGTRTDIVEPHGDRGVRQESTSEQRPPRLPIPAFGQWHELLRLAKEATSEVVDAVHHELPVSVESSAPWRPPRPLKPDGIEELFVPGTIVEIHDKRLQLSVHEAGELRLTSGRLVAADPSSLEFDAEPFTVTVPPGTYPVSISLATFLDDPRHSRVCAARLAVDDRPTVRWELALRDGQEIIDLGNRQFFGFGVDAGMACFVDADASERMKDVWLTLDGLVDPRHRTIDSGEMVAWSSGWGDGAYPTWIGYDAGGSVTCFVADMLLFPTDHDDD
ncbi:hypothetical protein JOD64_005592 [Micromonospora luteifusca]|uniref:DUF4241 domain-containing protein n=1 Tax=Micromonospora luteifusca TaxID=709860 RepID=A0ABS2M1N3_9ACTN|nr:DUF4241 domain-containing protein [Micromonospora luteifusca]MBM7494370.1 hypothetical protein [Micromonospora luteifusca]